MLGFSTFRNLFFSVIISTIVLFLIACGTFEQFSVSAFGLFALSVLRTPSCGFGKAFKIGHFALFCKNPNV